MSLRAADGHERKHLASELPVTESRIERDGLKAGTQAPLFTLSDLDGRQLSLSAYRGRRVLLVFSDPNCGPCNAVAPDLNRLAAKKSALDLIMVSRGDLEENRQKASEHGFAFPVVLQDTWKLSKEYGIFATPVAFLIDENGVIEKPVAIGADQILALAEAEPALASPASTSRWSALGRIAAAFAAGFALQPLRAEAYVQCPAGLADCSLQGRCDTNINTDVNNCGSCGHLCPAGSVCTAGMCIVSCQAGQANCGGHCANLATDSANCGACGHACAAGSICVNGACVVSCPTGQTNCGGHCANLSNDPANCGGCGHACPPGGVCIAGACTFICPPGQVNCANKCVTLATDNANCGACGHGCAAGHVCVGGACVLSCQAGLTNCSGTCVNTATDSANCGSCGHACPPKSVCKNGSCVTIC
jgi:peroxiredoxin